MKLHTNIEQNSVDWEILRSGKITASEMDALISPLGEIRKGEGVQTYLNQKLCERWTGGPFSVLHGTFDMMQGAIIEEKARPAFTIHTGLEVQKVAFIETSDGRSGCSPDGIVGTESGVEIKSPRMDTHIGYLLAGKLPKQYVAQVQGCLFVTGFDRWHFFSYRNGFPPLHVVVERDEKFQEALTEAVENFIERLDNAMLRLVELNGGPNRKAIPRPEPKSYVAGWDVIP